MINKLSGKLELLVRKLENLPVTQLFRLDAILSDLGNLILEIDEKITGPKTQKKISSAEIRGLEKKLVALADMLYKMQYDSHYMDRALHKLDFSLENIKNKK